MTSTRRGSAVRTLRKGGALSATLVPSLVCSLCITSSVSHAARPLLTDDARIVDPGSCQVEAWLQRQPATASTPQSSERWMLPACRIGDGEWTLGGQLGQGWVFQRKALIRPLEPGDWGWAATVGATRPAGGHASDGSGGGASGYGVLPFTWLAANEATAVHLNVGVLWGPRARDAAASPAHRWQSTAGIGLERALSGDLWLIAEATVPAAGRRQQQLGLRWWLIPQQLQWDATLVQSQGDRPGRSATLGLRWIFPQR